MHHLSWPLHSLQCASFGVAMVVAAVLSNAALNGIALRVAARLDNYPKRRQLGKRNFQSSEVLVFLLMWCVLPMGALRAYNKRRDGRGDCQSTQSTNPARGWDTKAATKSFHGIITFCMGVWSPIHGHLHIPQQITLKRVFRPSVGVRSIYPRFWRGCYEVIQIYEIGCLTPCRIIMFGRHNYLPLPFSILSQLPVAIYILGRGGGGAERYTPCFDPQNHESFGTGFYFEPK